MRPSLPSPPPIAGALAGVPLDPEPIRERMQAVYAAHNPAKLGSVDALLQK